jgi:hypothetical protein
VVDAIELTNLERTTGQGLELRFRAEPVPWWNLFFGWIGMVLGTQLPELRRATTEIVPGDLVTVGAVANGRADFGFTTPPACTTMGYRGVGCFPEKRENLRAIANFPHDDRLIWAVPAELGVTSIEELRDLKLRIALGGAGSPVGFAVEKILEAYGMPRKELEARGWEFKTADYLFQVVSMGITGEADIVVHEGRKTPPWSQLLQTREMMLLPIREDVIDELVAGYGFLRGVPHEGNARRLRRRRPADARLVRLVAVHARRRGRGARASRRERRRRVQAPLRMGVRRTAPGEERSHPPDRARRVHLLGRDAGCADFAGGSSLCTPRASNPSSNGKGSSMSASTSCSSTPPSPARRRALLEALAARVDPGHGGTRPCKRHGQPAAAAAQVEHPPGARDRGEQLGRAERQLLRHRASLRIHGVTHPGGGIRGTHSETTSGAMKDS